MLAYHFLVWLLKTSARGYFFRVVQISATFFAPAMFFIITGMTLSFSVMRRRLQGDSTGLISVYVLQRYGGLMLIGFLLNVIIWGYKSFWIWDVLEVIGLSNILAFLVFVFLSSSDIVLLLVGSLGLASYYLILNVHLPPFWEAILHNPLKGIFPFGPFLFFTLLGVIFGRRIINIVRDEKEVTVCNLCLQSGGTLLLLSLLLYISGIAITRYPVSVSYILFVTGITLLALGLLFWWQDVRGSRILLLRPIIVYGRYALAIYIGHYLAYRIFAFLDLGRRLFLWSSVAASTVLFVIIFGVTIYIKPGAWGEVVGLKPTTPQRGS